MFQVIKTCVRCQLPHLFPLPALLLPLQHAHALLEYLLFKVAHYCDEVLHVIQVHLHSQYPSGTVP
jgi:hypothetical protein